MKPRHFHLACAIGLAVVAVGLWVVGRALPAGFVALGALVAAIHWSAAKRLTDGE